MGGCDGAGVVEQVNLCELWLTLYHRLNVRVHTCVLCNGSRWHCFAPPNMSGLISRVALF